MIPNLTPDNNTIDIMDTKSIDKKRLIRESVAALQADDANKARELFEQVVAADANDAASWLGLAFACARLGDDKSTLESVDKALSLEPGNLRALIFKADHLEQSDRSRQALEFYQAALKIAARTAQLPDDVKQGLGRAQAACSRLDAEYETFLLEKLHAHGFRRGQSSPRFEQSLDISCGRRNIYHQEPRRFYFSSLPQIQFYERRQFPWIESLEAATTGIRDELLSVLADTDNFAPYLDAESDTPHLNRGDNTLVNNPDWGAFYLWEYGTVVEKNAQLCPQAIKALAAAPLPIIPGQAPMALFSRLAPGTRIPPHNGLLNTRLICHLPIIVPANCGALRCGNEIRPWTEGEILIFDDSIEHEAWNDSDVERVVLLFEVWRPELTAEERELIAVMLTAVKDYHAG